MHRRLFYTIVALLIVASMTFAPLASAAEVDEIAAVADDPTEAVDYSVKVTKVDNTIDGTTITWKAVPNAASYTLYLYNGSEWVELVSTNKLTYTHKPLVNNNTYQYSIIAQDKNGNFLSPFDYVGFENTFLAAPVISDLTASYDGVVVEWHDLPGAERYRVYRKEDNASWKRIGETDGNTFVDETAESGKAYSYTVRCISPDGKRFTSFHNSGKAIEYIASPKITSISNTATGAKLTWGACKGVDRYRVYLWDGTKWDKLGDSVTNSYLHDGLETGKSYTYTVRGILDDKFVNDFNHDGWTNTFIEPPVITALDCDDNGINITWNALEGAEKYRVYYRSANGWKRLGETAENHYLVQNVSSGSTYTFTVRCISEDLDRFMSFHNDGKSVKYTGSPKITSFSNTLTGTTISWPKTASGIRTRVYYKDGENWVRIGETAENSLVHDNLTSGQTFTYTVRNVDGNGKFVSDFNHDGWTNTFVEAPVITGFECTESGVKITWSKPAGAEKYRLYFRGSKGWTRLTDTEENSCTVSNLKKGSSYTFTVRCINSDATAFTSYHTSGKTVKYELPPQITGFTNSNTGTLVTWEKFTGAVKYRLYYKDGSGWKRIAETTGTSALHEGLKDGDTFTYTIRCLDAKGQFCSDFDRNGWDYTFMAPPEFTSVSKTDDGTVLTWAADEDAAGYRVYRKPFKGSWGRIVDAVTETTFTDTTAEADKLYAYTLRCLDGEGNLITGYIDSNVYYINGVPADGDITVDGTKYHFENGSLRSGYLTENGKTYYYDQDGKVMKSAIVGNATDGYCYAGSTGAIDYGYCNGVSYKGENWNVINGKATKVSGESAKTLHKALKLVAKVTTSSMTKEQKLRKLFDYIRSNYTEKNPRIPHYHGADWPIIYANDILDNGVGNCFSYASTFAYCAVAIGYTNVYACNSSGHGWAEIDGKVYDPEWSRHRSGYSYYGMSYNEPCDVNYKAGIAPGYSWMHVKIQ